MQPRLLKVPKWLSEIWLRSPPDEIVADLDLSARNSVCNIAMCVQVQGRAKGAEKASFTGQREPKGCLNEGGRESARFQNP